MIKKIEIEGDIIHLKKSLNIWKVVYPIKNDDGSYNWKNLLTGGNWMNLFWLGIFIIILLLCLVEYSNALKIANECLSQLNNRRILL